MACVKLRRERPGDHRQNKQPPALGIGEIEADDLRVVRASTGELELPAADRDVEQLLVRVTPAGERGNRTAVRRRCYWHDSISLAGRLREVDPNRRSR
jgi:hypothetical protein